MNRFIKPLVVFVTAGFIFGCTTTSIPKYNPKEFETTNYQKNVDNAIDASDLLSDFDQTKVPTATLETSDVSYLVQADLYYNQGNYAKASPLYSQLAEKYKDPRIIYKAIICLEHVSSTPSQVQELNSLISLFIKTDPDSNISKLFQIKQSLNNKDAKSAEKNLDGLINKNQSKGRVIFLFISSIISNDLKPEASDSLVEFADYIVNQYTAYPEAHLCAIIAYSVANNQEGLAEQINRIHKYYKNWYVPIYWSSDVLMRHNHSSTLTKVLEPLVTAPQPDKVLQNIYIAALLNDNQTAKAKVYLLTQLDSVNRDNVLLDLGIVATKEQDYKSALNYFNQVKITDRTLADVVALVKASIYDSQNQTALAIENYKQISNTQYLSSISNVMLLNAYLNQNNLIAVDALLNKLAIEAKMNEEQTLLFKSGYYLSESRYQVAYDLIQSKYSEYSKYPDYKYQYAALTSLLGRTKEAIVLYKAYIKAHPDQAFGYNDLAYIYAEQTHDYKTAQKYGEMAYKLAPTDPNVLDTLGWVYHKQGADIKALPYIKASYETNYDPESAKHLIAVYTSLQRPDLAKSVLLIEKPQLQRELKQQLVQRSLMLLIYLQLGIEVKK